MKSYVTRTEVIKLNQSFFLTVGRTGLMKRKEIFFFLTSLTVVRHSYRKRRNGRKSMMDLQACAIAGKLKRFKAIISKGGSAFPRYCRLPVANMRSCKKYPPTGFILINFPCKYPSAGEDRTAGISSSGRRL